MSQSRLRYLAEILVLVALTPAALEMAVAEAEGLQAGAAAVDETLLPIAPQRVCRASEAAGAKQTFFFDKPSV
jgi:hypothetical protein